MADDNAVEEIVEALDSNESADANADASEKVTSDSESDEIFFDDSEYKPIGDEEDDSKGEKDTTKDSKEETEEDGEANEEAEDEQRAAGGIIKEAAEKYKGVFKEFPQLKGAYYRDREFSKVFPTPEAAHEAAQDVEIYNNVQREFINGKPESLVRFFEEHKKPETLIRFGRNFLENVGKSDRNLWAGIIFPSITGILREADNAANAAGNKNLSASVKHITNYLFGQIDIPEDKLPREVRNEDGNNEAVSQLINRQKQNFQDDVYEAGAVEAFRIVDSSLATLKCKPALKKAITKELFDKVTRAIARDTALQSDLNSRWAAALRAGLGHRSKASILNTYLAGVKNKLPKAREAVLKSNGFIIRKGANKPATENTNGQDKREPDIVDNRPGRRSNQPGERRDKNDMRGLTDLQKLEKLIGPVR